MNELYQQEIREMKCSAHEPAAFGELADGNGNGPNDD
jgi:hypothetical protein